VRATPTSRPFPVVALGASAGGIAAVRTCLAGLSEGCEGAAYVLAMHLDPSRDSALVPLLDGKSPLAVREMKEGDGLTPGTLLVVPPGQSASVEGEHLRLTPRTTAGTFSIDHLFGSLARELGSRVIGIVLSGNGTDGTEGLLEIQQWGGLTVAQAPDALEHPDMPLSAISAGAADQVLAAEAMGESLARWLTDPLDPDPKAVEEDKAVLERILEIVFQRTGADFSGYKLAPQERRIHRRQRLARSRSLQDYADRVERNLGETHRLRRDLLIRVTQFYRDPQAFKELVDAGLLPLIRDWQGTAPLRVWVAACSTGEEAYTLAMLLLDLMQEQGVSIPLQIFATDVDPDSIRVARKGRYPAHIAAHVPAAWLQTHLLEDEDGFQVSKRVRESIVFSTHDLLRDPPFSRLDLVSCRNLLIYLTSSAQDRVVETFHYALNPGGLLFLGNAESVPTDSPLFEPLGTRARLYRRTDHPTRRTPRKYRTNYHPGGGERDGMTPGSSGSGASARLDIDEATRALVRHFAPPAVLLDQQGDVVYFFEGSDAFFRPPAGPPGLHVLQLIIEPLQAPLRCLLHQYRGQEKTDPEALSAPMAWRPVSVPGAQGESEQIRLVIQPVQSPPGGLILVLETVHAPYSMRDEDARPPEVREGGAVEALQEELTRTQLSLNHAIQDLERANAGLRASNEDLLSINEEVQSTNEELETSKEELESVNEELGLVNAELREKILELDRVNGDLQNLMASTQIATVFVDGEGRVLQYTPAATCIFRLIPSDRGRPLRDLSHGLGLTGDELDAMIQQVRHEIAGDADGAPLVQTEVPGPDGSIFMVQAFPYRAMSGQVDGAVLNFIDLTAIRTLEADLRRLATSIDHFPIPFLILDEAWRIVSWNEGAQTTYGYETEEVLGSDYFSLVPEDTRDQERARLTDLRASQTSQAFRVTRQRKSGEIFPALNEVSWFQDGDQILTTIADRDFTERARVETQAALLTRELDHRVKNTLALVQGLLEYSSLTAGNSMEAFIQAFRERLQALANSQRALASGPGASASLRELLKRGIHSLGLGDRVRIKGPALELRGDLAFPMAMTIHELTTNAVRHGALAAPRGKVRIQWMVDESRVLTLIWKEEGGPPAHPPQETGFGTRLILEALPYQTGGAAHVEYLETGIQWTITVPL